MDRFSILLVASGYMELYNTEACKLVEDSSRVKHNLVTTSQRQIQLCGQLCYAWVYLNSVAVLNQPANFCKLLFHSGSLSVER